MEVAIVLAVLKSRYGRIQRSSRVAGLRKCRDLVGEGKVFIKNKVKVASRVGCSERRVVYFRKLLFKSNKKKLSFRRVESCEPEHRTATLQERRIWRHFVDVVSTTTRVYACNWWPPTTSTRCISTDVTKWSQKKGIVRTWSELMTSRHTLKLTHNEYWCILCRSSALRQFIPCFLFIYIQISSFCRFDLCFSSFRVCRDVRAKQ